ncbi:hypothetical protein, partial [Luteibacter sp. dw_328]|uniref:hypothetical protein n=1 Tax=Luteibacter sp. dw_328 TaxID=2719796 RepID=UPI001BD221A5
PVRNAEDVSEQRGWAPKALRRHFYTPKALRLTAFSVPGIPRRTKKKASPSRDWPFMCSKQRLVE